MATTSLDTQIQARIQSFLGELSGLVKKQALEAVQGALADGAPARRGPGRPRKMTMSLASARPRIAKAGRRARRATADIQAIAERVLGYVESNAGQRLEEIGRGLKTDTAILKRPIVRLVAEGKLRTAGQKRGTKYFSGRGNGGGAPKAKRAGRKAKRK